MHKDDLKNTFIEQLTKKLKKLLSNEYVQDIIVFGSTVKNKISPGDLDIAVLVSEKRDEVRNLIKKSLPGVDVQLISLEDLYSTLFLTLIKEGYSLKKNRYLKELYGISPVKLYKYTLKSLTPSKKVMFERGIKKILGLTRLSNRVVLVPIEYSAEFDDFLRLWDLDIDTAEYELVPLMRKEEN